LKNPKFFTPKSADIRTCLPPCPKNVRTGQTPSLLTADVFLWTAFLVWRYIYVNFCFTRAALPKSWATSRHWW